MKHLILAMCLARRCRRPADQAHRRGHLARRRRQLLDAARHERWISLQLQHDGSNNGIGIPERDAAGAGGPRRRRPGPLHAAARRRHVRLHRPPRPTAAARGDFTLHADADFVSGMGGSATGLPTTCGARAHDVTRTCRLQGGRRFDDVVAHPRATPPSRRTSRRRALGRPTSTTLVKMRIHGVTPEFIKAMRDLGFKDLPIDQPRGVPHPRRHAGVRQVVQRSRLQEPRRRRSTSRCGSTA